MKRQYINFLGIILIISIMFSCDDFVDVKPKGQIIPQSVDDYRKILDLAVKSNVGLEVTILRTYGITNYLSDYYQVGTQEQYDGILNNSDRLQKYNWAQGGFLYLEDEEDIDWKTLYGQIYIANSVLDGIPDASGSESDRNELMAEARIHRAFCYLALVNIYAQHFNPSTSGTELAVPLRLSVSLSESLDRATVQEVYNQVIEDIELALPNLLNTQPYNHRPTKAAAYGLLARTYLYQGGYSLALENANLCLDLQNGLYDYNEVLELDDPESDRYYFFADPDHQSWDDIEMILQKNTATRTVSGDTYHHGNFTTSDELLEMVYDTDNDLRYNFYFRPETDEATGDTLFYSYRETGRRWEDGYYPFVGISVPEVLLIKAEANVRLGNKAAAINDLNTLRVNRLRESTYSDLNPSDYTDAQAIELVKEERRKELVFRGLRWFDLKRYNAIGENVTIERLFSGETLAPGDPGWVMPISPLYISE